MPSNNITTVGWRFRDLQITLISFRSTFPFLSMSNMLKIRNDYIRGSAFDSSITRGSTDAAGFEIFTFAFVTNPSKGYPD